MWDPWCGICTRKETIIVPDSALQTPPAPRRTCIGAERTEEFEIIRIAGELISKLTRDSQYGFPLKRWRSCLIGASLTWLPIWDRLRFRGRIEGSDLPTFHFAPG